jgi:hypothetical protein
MAQKNCGCPLERVKKKNQEISFPQSVLKVVSNEMSKFGANQGIM